MLYDAKADLFRFPFVADEYEESWAPIEPGKGLTNYVYRTGKPMLVTPEVFTQLARAGETNLVGRKAVDWLGVPLKTRARRIGVMAMETYTRTARLADSEQRDSDVRSQSGCHGDRTQTGRRKDPPVQSSALAGDEIDRAISEVTDLDRTRDYSSAIAQGGRF